MQKTQSQAEMMADLTFELSKACHEKEHYFASMYDLTTAEFRALRLFRHTDTISVKELCREMKLTPGRITHILTSLEEKDLITREVDRSDRRSINVILTSKSIPFIKKINEGHKKLHLEILSGIESDKRESIICAMNELVKAIQSWSESK